MKILWAAAKTQKKKKKAIKSCYIEIKAKAFIAMKKKKTRIYILFYKALSMMITLCSKTEKNEQVSKSEAPFRQDSMSFMTPAVPTLPLLTDLVCIAPSIKKSLGRSLKLQSLTFDFFCILSLLMKIPNEWNRNKWGFTVSYRFTINFVWLNKSNIHVV